MNIQPYPMMDEPEVVAMAAVLRKKEPERVLEWGGGGSTLYWPKLYPDVEWITIEHNSEWANAVSEAMPENVTLLERNYPEYYQYDESLGLFDIVIVDGRKRVMCLSTARKYLKEDGIVLLHDAGRERYATGVAFYKDKRVLVQPKKEKDPRGLFLLTNPKQRTQGVIYMAWGENATERAYASMQSLWVHEPEMPVMVLGDSGAKRFYEDKVAFELVRTNPFDKKQKEGYTFLAGRIKPLMAKLSPFDETLYVDADTEFKQTPKPGFDLLDRWDLVVAETQTRDLDSGVAGFEECRETAEELGAPYILYHNSGMIFWRKNDRTERLFDLWKEEWMRYQAWDEQVALLRALLRSEAMFLTVPYTWNHWNPEDSYIIHHQFGIGQARIETNIIPVSVRERNLAARRKA